MLEALNIRNLALVAELSLEFLPGLNTVTGETGAGKSLIIGALQLLAGGRASSSRTRCPSTTTDPERPRLPNGFPAGVPHAILPSWKRAESIGGLDFLWFERGFADIIIL